MSLREANESQAFTKHLLAILLRDSIWQRSRNRWFFYIWIPNQAKVTHVAAHVRAHMSGCTLLPKKRKNLNQNYSVGRESRRATRHPSGAHPSPRPLHWVSNMHSHVFWTQNRSIDSGMALRDQLQGATWWHTTPAPPLRKKIKWIKITFVSRRSSQKGRGLLLRASHGRGKCRVLLYGRRIFTKIWAQHYDVCVQAINQLASAAALMHGVRLQPLSRAAFIPLYNLSESSALLCPNSTTEPNSSLI